MQRSPQGSGAPASAGVTIGWRRGLVSGSVVHPVPEEWAKHALIDAAAYQEKYRRSIEDPDGFWREEAARIDWVRPLTRVKDTSFD